MKVLLLQPPIEDFYDTDIRLQPLGLCYLKSAVETHLPQVSVSVKDFHQGWGRYTTALPDKLSYLRRYYPFPDKSPFSSFYQYYHFGASYQQIAEQVHEMAPDIIGISSLFSPYYLEVLQTAQEIKRRLAVPIILGGTHASVDYEHLLTFPAIDYIIRGEGERPFVEFLKCYIAQGDFSLVPNLAYRENGCLVLNQPENNYHIQELPIPDFSDLDTKNYHYSGKPLCFVLTSRGCPYHCNFCSVHQTFGCTYRKRSPESVLDEIRIRYQAGARVFDFEDDHLTFSRAVFVRLCRLLIEEYQGREVEFLAMNGVSYESLDAELLRLMWEAGFRQLNLSLVTANESLLRASGRPHKIAKYLQVLQEARLLGFKITSYQIIGLPDEELSSMVATLVLGASLPVLIGPSVFYLAPGSPLAAQAGKRSPQDYLQARLTALAEESVHCSRDDLYTLFVSTRIINFIKGLVFEESEIALSDLLAKDFSADIRTSIGIRILSELLAEGRLNAWTKEGFKQLPRFQLSLFEELWSRLDCIQTQDGSLVLPVMDKEIT